MLLHDPKLQTVSMLNRSALWGTVPKVCTFCLNDSWFQKSHRLLIVWSPGERREIWVAGNEYAWQYRFQNSLIPDSLISKETQHENHVTERQLRDTEHLVEWITSHKLVSYWDKGWLRDWNVLNMVRDRNCFGGYFSGRDLTNCTNWPYGKRCAFSFTRLLQCIPSQLKIQRHLYMEDQNSA